MPYNGYTPSQNIDAQRSREQFALDKYNALSEDERAVIDEQVARLHKHFGSRNFKGEPSFVYKLDLLMMVGTILNEKERHGK